jgi:hypothetical protein
MFRCCCAAFAVALLTALSSEAADAPPAFALHSNDVVAFVGGADVAAAQFTGHLEALLAVKFPGTRFRNFGWEGDTVFALPRDVGFPPLTEHLKRAGTTVIFVQYGRAEALSGKGLNFTNAYEKLLGELEKQTTRLVLVTPPPFEKAGEPLPDLSPRNAKLAENAAVIRAVAQKRSLPIVDLFSEFGGTSHVAPQLTDNGLQLSPRGHGLVAGALARQLGFDDLIARALKVNASGTWSNPQFEKLRVVVIEKNKLWFNYWRPQNWAFLGGDRTSQPSSRDHRDLKVRWFPAEMEKFVPLIAEKEAEMEKAAEQIRGTRK